MQTYQYANKIEANVKVSGTVFGAGSDVYSELEGYRREPSITMLLMDIDDYAKNFQELQPPTGRMQEMSQTRSFYVRKSIRIDKNTLSFN